MHALVFAQLLFISAHVFAYIPAVPSNDTNAVNQTDMSTLTMKWAPAGLYSNTVSFQLARNNSRGFQRGALVHFSERNLTDQNSTTPWIALISCDANATDASQDIDVFTLARDRGAHGALLYSLTSEACLINPEYASPDNFEQIMDIFASQSKATANIIESQFSNLHNASFKEYNARQLNDSLPTVLSSLETNEITSPFIIAVLRSSNSTVNVNTSTPDSSSSSGDAGGGGNSNTSLAMIILYAITGCISTLFIVVIFSGAIRAIRHPERYGPRAGSENGGAPGTTAQSRTGGIGRAILDTFPIIKFGKSNATGTGFPEAKLYDAESRVAPATIEMRERGEVLQSQAESPRTDSGREGIEYEAIAEASSSPARVTRSAEKQAEQDAVASPPASAVDSGEDSGAEEAVKPAAIGHETCPICIVDFEEGDDLRVLPCEGKHRFHQACVDQWLLELSSSCPLCREDFQALEDIIAESESARPSGSSSVDAGSSRFSKYLKFVKRGRPGARGEPTNASQPELQQGVEDG